MSDYIPQKDVAKMMRRDLKTAFPNTKFSVRCRTWSMGGEIGISWTNGPTQSSVGDILDKYVDRGFDGMIDLAYHIDHWQLPDGSVVQKSNGRGTTGSMGMVGAWENDKPHPDAKRVSLSCSSPSYRRDTTDAFINTVRRAFAELDERQRHSLLEKTDALRCVMSYEMPQSYHLDADLRDFGENAPRIFEHLARRIDGPKS